MGSANRRNLCHRRCPRRRSRTETCGRRLYCKALLRYGSALLLEPGSACGPVSTVPIGSYAKSDVTPAVWNDLYKFDELSTLMLNQLQDAGPPAALWWIRSRPLVRCRIRSRGAPAPAARAFA